MYSINGFNGYSTDEATARVANVIVIRKCF